MEKSVLIPQKTNVVIIASGAMRRIRLLKYDENDELRHKDSVTKNPESTKKRSTPMCPTENILVQEGRVSL